MVPLRVFYPCGISQRCRAHNGHGFKLCMFTASSIGGGVMLFPIAVLIFTTPNESISQFVLRFSLLLSTVCPWSNSSREVMTTLQYFFHGKTLPTTERAQLSVTLPVPGFVRADFYFSRIFQFAISIMTDNLQRWSWWSCGNKML